MAKPFPERMIRSLLAAFVCLVLGACASKPVRTTETNRPSTETRVHDEFVARRTAELERMGGPFANRTVADAKAREEARSRYGERPPDYSTTWSWGHGAGGIETEQEVNETLEEIDRDVPRR